VILLIRGGVVYAPARVGSASVLSLNGTVAVVGEVNPAALDSVGVDVDTLDAAGCIVTPGLIDPHVHLIGGSGEQGHGSATPEIAPGELIEAGVTTVVGCLGVDTTMKPMTTLVGKAKGLRAEGITAHVYSGGYNVPPATLMGSLRSDVMFVAEVIGAGEIAISDRRGTQPTTAELARVVADAYVGGLLSGKAGVTHFHVGDGRAGLKPLRELLDGYDVEPRCLYPSHVERTPDLLREAAAITAHGVFVDIDTVGNDLADALAAFTSASGDLTHLTISSDASITPPRQRLDQLRALRETRGWPVERWLPLVTTNVADVLKLPRKGHLAPGADADLLVLHEDTLALRHVVAQGRVLMRDGVMNTRDRILQDHSRRITIHADQT